MMPAAESETLLVRAYDCIAHAPSLEAAILELREVFKVQHIIYQAARFGARSIDDPFIRLTYPGEWVKRYLTKGYMNVDPVVREGFKRTLPFDWSEFIGESAAEQAFFMDALQHGVGPNGLSIPLISREGHRALFSVCAGGTAAEWSQWKDERLSALIETANRLHQRAIETIFETKPDKAKLAPREIECLHWIAQGKDTVEVAMILGLSQHTVRTYLKAARFKLSCATIAAAVHKAAQLGIIQA
jgi:DNA-binding CsgD family transcriptional regulator